ncbi:MAG: hypothetical protein ACI8QZ_001463 [Chlamydiales bacterium]|jgi:hypothetical protein
MVRMDMLSLLIASALLAVPDGDAIVPQDEGADAEVDWQMPASSVPS